MYNPYFEAVAVSEPAHKLVADLLLSVLEFSYIEYYTRDKKFISLNDNPILDKPTAVSEIRSGQSKVAFFSSLKSSFLH